MSSLTMICKSITIIHKSDTFDYIFNTPVLPELVESNI